MDLFILSLFGELTWYTPFKGIFQVLHGYSSSVDSLNSRWDLWHRSSQQMSRTAPKSLCVVTMQILLFQIATQVSEAQFLGICCILTKNH